MDATQKPPLNVAILARTSSDDRRRKDGMKSIPEQINNCKAVCKSNGYNIVLVETDVDRSGRTYPTGFEATSEIDQVFQNYFREHIKNQKAKYREGLGNIFKKVASLNISIIVVNDMTRLMRPISDSFLQSSIIQRLNQHKMQVHCVDTGLVDFRVFSSVMLTAISSIAMDDEIMRRVRNSRNKLRLLKNDGMLTGKTSIGVGYRIVGKQKVEQDPDKAPVIAQIFRWYIEENKSKAQVVRDLHERDFRMPQRVFMGKTLARTLDFDDITRILRNPCYCGKQRNTDGILIDSKVITNPIVPYELWQKAQARRANTVKYIKPQAQWVNPFQRLTYCGFCGSHLVIKASMRLKNGEGSRTLKCFKNITLGGSCVKKSAIQLMSTTIDGNDRCGLFLSLFPLAFIALLRNIIQRKDAETTTQLDQIQQKLKEIQEKQRLLDDMYEKQEYNPVSYRERSKALTDKHRSLSNELRHHEQVDREHVSQKEFHALIASGGDALMNDGQRLHALLSDIIDKLEVFERHVMISLKDGEAFYLPRLMVHNTRFMPYNHFKWKNNELAIYFTALNMADDADNEQLADTKFRVLLETKDYRICLDEVCYEELLETLMRDSQEFTPENLKKALKWMEKKSKSG